MPVRRDGTPSGATNLVGTVNNVTLGAAASGAIANFAPTAGEFLWIQSVTVSAVAAASFTLSENTGTIFAAGAVPAAGAWTHIFPGGGVPLSVVDATLSLVAIDATDYSVTITGYSLKDIPHKSRVIPLPM